MSYELLLCLLLGLFLFVASSRVISESAIRKIFVEIRKSDVSDRPAKMHEWAKN